MTKEEFGVETCIGSTQGQEAIRCQFQIMTDSAGLFADKKRCRFCEKDKCVLCDSGEVEDVVHFLVLCEEFQWPGEAGIIKKDRRH